MLLNEIFIVGRLAQRIHLSLGPGKIIAGGNLKLVILMSSQKLLQFNCGLFIQALGK
jgi:hypothetical protein